MSTAGQSGLTVNADGSVVAQAGAKLPLYICLGWGLGSTGMLAILQVVNALVLKYVVDFLGMTAVVAGTLIAVTRIFDAAIDPFMGMLSDNTRTRWGRRRPFLLVGSFLCGLTPLMLFAVPQHVTAIPLAAMVTVGLLFYAVAYTTFNVPYMAMPVEMTQSHHERTYLFSFRIYGIAVGGLIGGALSPWLITYFGEDAKAFEYMSYCLGACVFATLFISFLLTSKAPVLNVTQAAKKPGFSDLRLVLKNKPFLLLLLAKIFIVAGTGTGAAAMAFLVTRVIGQTLSWFGLFAALSTVGMIASQSLWVWVAKQIGKRKTFLISAAIWTVITLTWLLVGTGETQWGIGIRGFLLGFFAGGILLTTQSMLPDCLEHEVKITGLRHEGTMTGLYTTVERGSSAVGVALAGLILSLGGYVGTADVLTPEAIRAIYVCVGITPAAMMCISIAAILRYDLPG